MQSKQRTNGEEEATLSPSGQAGRESAADRQLGSTAPCYMTQLCRTAEQE